MTEFMTAVTAAGPTLIGYVGAAAGVGLTVALVTYGAKKAWRAFKSIG